MNSAAIILGAIVLVPIVLLMGLRINAALVFLSLCLGDVLVQFVASSGNSVNKLLASQQQVHAVTSNSSDFKLILLLLPVVLTATIMIKTVRGHRLWLNILPAAGVGLLGGLLAVPLLSAGLSHSIIDSSLWAQAKRSQDIIVGASAAACLVALWLQRPKHRGGEEKHEKHGKHHHG